MRKILKTTVIMILLMVSGYSNGQNWTEVLNTYSSDGSSNDVFGYSVSVSGKNAIVGAMGEKHDVNGQNYVNRSGSAYFLELNDQGSWVETQKVVSTDRGVTEFFGSTVGISGNYAIVGSYQDHHDEAGTDSIQEAGSAFIFERNESGVWEMKKKLLAPERTVFDQFGYSVDISGDFAAVGAIWEDEDPIDSASVGNSGSVFIYKRDAAGNWEFYQKIKASDWSVSDQFGYAVSIDGDRLIASSNQEDHDVSGGAYFIYAGAAYIFELDQDGDWVEKNKITASHRSSYDFFGQSVDIYGDYAVVGAHNEDHDSSGSNSMSDAGAAYVYHRDAVGNWSLLQKLVPSDRNTGDYFGNAVSISNNLITVGAPREDEDVSGSNTLCAAGAVYVYELDNTGSWTEVQKIVNSDRASLDGFGSTVGMSGSLIMVGAHAKLSNYGKVYAYCGASKAELSTVKCDSYSSPAGNTYNTTGIYEDTLANIYGCDSIITIDLTIETLAEVSVVENGDVLVSSNDSADAYQWYLDGSPISGAVSKTYSPTESGEYSVEITVGTCMETSVGLTYSIGGLEELNSPEVTIYPNPSNGRVFIDFGNSLKSKILVVTNSLGQVVFERSVTNGSNNEISFDLKPGIYQLIVVGENLMVSKQLVVKQGW